MIHLSSPITSMKHLAFILLLTLASCSSGLNVGPEVKLLVIANDKGKVIAEKRLKKEGCTFIKRVEAIIEPGSTDYTQRLLLGLKYKVYEEGGNTVISNLKPHGVPMHTYGFAYNCKS